MPVRSAVSVAIQSAILGAMRRDPAIWTDLLPLFTNGEQGVWYDPSDLTTLFQDAAGTTPVTSAGDPVGLMLDKSQGLELGPELVVNGDFSAGLSNWTGAGGAASNVVDGILIVDYSVAAGGRYQDLGGLVNGNYYKITVLAKTDSKGTIWISFNNDFLGNNVKKLITNSEYQEFVFYVKPISTSIRVYFQALGVGDNLQIDNVEVKELKGNHAYQTTSAARPLLGRVPVTGKRQLLTYSNDYLNPDWPSSELTVVDTGEFDGNYKVFKLVPSTNLTTHNIRQAYKTVEAGSNVVYWQKIKPNDNYRRIILYLNDGQTGSALITFNLDTGQSFVNSGGQGEFTEIGRGIIDHGDGFFTCYVTAKLGATRTSVTGFTLLANNSGASTFAGDGITGIDLSISQLEVGTFPSNYQDSKTALDVTEQGVRGAWYLQGDGVDDGMMTAPIDFTATDEVSMFSAFNRTADINGNLFELSPLWTTYTGTFLMASGISNGDDFGITSRGTANSINIGLGSYDAPVKQVGAGLAKIGNDANLLRINGVEVRSVTNDQGAGNYGNYNLYILARNSGAASLFRGQMFGGVIVGRLLNSLEIEKTEQYLANKAGVTL